MKRLVIALALVLFGAAPAKENAAMPTTPEIRLDIVPVMDAKPRRFVFVLGGVAYETLDGLKLYVEVMPKENVLVLDPGCHRWGGEPLLESEKDLEDFKAFVKKQGKTLKVIPSG